MGLAKRPTCEVCGRRLASVFFAMFHATPMAVCQGCIGVCGAKVEFDYEPRKQPEVFHGHDESRSLPR